MLVMMTMICAILLSSLSVFLFKQYSARSIRDTYTISAEQLEQTYRMVEAQLMNVYNYYAKLYASNSNVFNALYADQFDAEEMYEINKTLGVSMQVSPLVSSVYIMNHSADAVFYSGSTIRTFGDFYDTDIIAYMAKGHADKQSIFMPRNVQYRIYDKQEEHRYITVVFADAAKNGSVDAALIVNISQDKIKDLLVPETGGQGLQTEITDESYFQMIRSDAARSGYFTTRIDEKEYFITHLKSSSMLGWYFISVMEYDQLVASITQLRDVVLLVTGLFIILSAVISLFFVRSLYKPIHRLIHRMKKTGRLHGDSSASEFEYLGDAFDHLTANISGLNHIVRAYRPAKKKELLERLIRDEIYLNKGTEEELQSAGIPPHSHYNLIVLLRIDSYQALTKRCSLRDIALYRFAMTNIITELLGSHVYVEEIESKEDTIVFLIGFENEKSVEGLRPILARLQNEVDKNLNLSITIALGSIFEQLKDISRSYYSALSAIQGRIQLGRGAIIDQAHVLETDSEPYVYPQEIEKRLLNSLKLEDERQYSKALDGFVTSVSNFAYDEIILSFTQLALAVVKTATAEMQADPERLGLQQTNIARQLAECDTFDEIKDWYSQLYAAIIHAVNERKDSRQGDMVKQLVDYIELHYSDPNLSVETLADLAHLSANHLRLIFKRELGKSISEYITATRFTHAMRLLRESDERIKDIAEKVGYVNTGYFYTSFKKYTGVSAAQYRDDHKVELS